MTRRERDRKRRRPRVTMLKIRAIPLVRMPKSRLFYLIKKACETGVIPNEIRITTLNWDHRVGRSFQPGQVLDAKDREELANCEAYLFGAITKHDVRVEKPR